MVDPGIAILISAAFASWGWIYSNRKQRHANRRHNTFQIFYNFRLSSKHARKIERLRDLKSAVDIPSPDDHSRVKDVRLIDELLDFYEFVAAAVLTGDMDESIVKSCEQTMIFSVTDQEALGSYVSKSREYQATVYDNLLDLAKRWEKDDRTWLQKTYEWWKMRPYVELPGHVKWLNKIIIFFRCCED